MEVEALAIGISSIFVGGLGVIGGILATWWSRGAVLRAEARADRAEARESEERQQELLDRAERAYHELMDLLQLAVQRPIALPEKRVEMTPHGMWSRNIVLPELPPWPFRAPLLPNGEIEELIKVAAGRVFTAYNEAETNRQTEGLPHKVSGQIESLAIEAMMALSSAISLHRGSWSSPNTTPEK